MQGRYDLDLKEWTYPNGGKSIDRGREEGKSGAQSQPYRNPWHVTVRSRQPDETGWGRIKKDFE